MPKANSPSTKPETPYSPERVELPPPIGSEQVLAWMKERQRPLTRQSYVDLNWPGMDYKPPYPPEVEAEIPAELPD